jgi:hypothetical protein
LSGRLVALLAGSSNHNWVKPAVALAAAMAVAAAACTSASIWAMPGEETIDYLDFAACATTASSTE